MSVLTWGKPKLEIVALVDGEIPGTPTWIELDIPVEDSSKLTTTKGNKLEAKEEGGGLVDAKYKENTYMFEFELFAKAGKTKPIADANGVVTDQYAIRLTPEDASLTGWIIKKANVSVEDTWDAANGGKWKHTFEGLKPTTGNVVQDYVQA